MVSKEGAIVEQYYLEGKEPVAGNNVETTIDITLQKVAEDSLAQVMQDLINPEINTSTGESTGLDAQGAAVVVMKVKTGEILACASYPTFNLETMNEDWDDIMNDELKPFFNRPSARTTPPAPPLRCAPWWPPWRTPTPKVSGSWIIWKPFRIRVCSPSWAMALIPSACCIPPFWPPTAPSTPPTR